jgi:hypothetical protein
MADATLAALTDDQLVGLLRDVLQECAARTVAVQAAARAVGLDEQEKLEVARRARQAAEAEAAERERALIAGRERQRVQEQKEAAEVAKLEELWEAKRAIARQLAAAIGRPAALQIWSKTETGERRVYVDTDPFGKRNQKFCLFVTGNQRHAPRSYETDMSLTPDSLQALVSLCDRVAADWRSIRVPKEAHEQPTD